MERTNQEHIDKAHKNEENIKAIENEVRKIIKYFYDGVWAYVAVDQSGSVVLYKNEPIIDPITHFGEGFWNDLDGDEDNYKELADIISLNNLWYVKENWKGLIWKIKD